MYRLGEAQRCCDEASGLLNAHREPTPIQIALLANRASLRLTKGRYAEAKRPFRNAESHASASLNVNNRWLISAYPGLAGVVLKTRRYSAALRFSERALVVIQRSPDNENRDDALFLMARIAAQRGKTTDAESYCERALNAWERSVGLSHPNYVSGLAGLT